MNDKKSKYNFTPKSLISKTNHKKLNINLNEEIKRNLYQNDSKNIRQNKIINEKNKVLSDNRFFTHIISNSNEDLSKNDNNNISQLLAKYLENIQINSNKKITNNEKKSDLENKKENNNDNFETNNNSSKLKYLISTNEKEKIDFISTLLKLKGINSDRKGNADKYLSSIEEYNNFSNNLKKKLKYPEKINQKKLIIESIANNDFPNNKEIKEKNLTDENNKLKEYYNKVDKNKKLKEKNKNKDIYINKTLSIRKGNIKEVTINLMDSNEEIINIKNIKKKKEKSFDNKSYRKTSENKKVNKIQMAKTQSLNKSPISNKLLKAKRIDNNKKINLNTIKGNNTKKLNNKKNSLQENKNKNENEKINKNRKKSNDKTEAQNKKKGKSKEKKENKKEVKKSFKKPVFNIYQNNIRNYDSRKLKRVQNHIFSVIDELDEEVKGDTINNNKAKGREENKEKNEDNNNKENIVIKTLQCKNEVNQVNNNNKYGLKNNNISILSNETFSNEIGFTDKKLLTSFLSSSTFNNDLVNYKPIDKNSSNLLINNNANLNNTNFSIINNSNLNINENNPNINNTLFTQTNNNNSKNNISEVIHLNPENEENTNFLIENNSNIINEIDPNDISDIVPLENKDITLDYKINVYNDNKLKNDIKNKCEISNEISSNDEEAESIIDQFDIINNKLQNESKEIKLSEIKNKEVLNDISNSNISITNLSKFTNFADSNIKFGEISHLSNKMNIKNSDIKKNNTNMEVIEESDQNSNNNTNNSKTNKKNDTSIKRIEHKTVKKINNKNNSNIENKIMNDFGKSINSVYINDEENSNDNYFCIKENEKNEIKNKTEDLNNNRNKKIKIKEEKEPKDSVRNDEPKDNFRNKTKIISFNELQKKYKSTNIFEDDDFNLSKKLINTNKKDVVRIDDDEENIRIHSIKNNKIKKIFLNESLNNEIIKNKQINYSPLSVRCNNNKEENIKNIINPHKMLFNNIKRIDKNSLKKIKNNSINEIKNQTLKYNNIKYLTNFENINNSQRNTNFFRKYSPSPPHNINKFLINDNYINKINEKQNNYSINNQIFYNNINNNNLDNLKNDKNSKEQRNFYFNNNNQFLYNNIYPSSGNIINLNKLNSNKDIIEYYYQHDPMTPKIMNINNIYKINEPYNVYIQ